MHPCFADGWKRFSLQMSDTVTSRTLLEDLQSHAYIHDFQLKHSLGHTALVEHVEQFQHNRDPTVPTSKRSSFR